MKLTVLFLFLSLSVFSQSVDELDKRNGFKDIKLMSTVHDYDGLEYAKDEFDENYKDVKVYTARKGYYTSIGNIKVYDLEVRTYRDSIYQIMVITEKNPDLYKGLKKVFGKPEYHMRKEFYHWTGKNLRLSYVPTQKDKLELTYESFLMREKLKDNKEQVIEDIASDF